MWISSSLIYTILAYSSGDPHFFILFQNHGWSIVRLSLASRLGLDHLLLRRQFEGDCSLGMLGYLFCHHRRGFLFLDLLLRNLPFNNLLKGPKDFQIHGVRTHLLLYSDL